VLRGDKFVPTTTVVPAEPRARQSAARNAAISMPGRLSRPRAARGSGASLSSASSMGRMFEIMNMFSTASPLLRIEDVVARLAYTRSTAYRYVRELCDAGLLAPSYGGYYTFGPRIIELERLLVLTDPLYRAGSGELPALRRDDSVLLLQKIYGDKVLCIYKEGPDVLEHNGQRIRIKRARGLPFPLFRGAASLALLAWMPPHRIRETYLHNTSEIATRGLGEDWKTFQAILARIRQAGHAVSRGQFSSRVIAVGVPIILPTEKQLVGSLVEVFTCDETNAEHEAACAARLHAVSERIAAAFMHIVANAANTSAGSGRQPAPAAFRKRGRANLSERTQ
jgi:DNA-binding IclR family transcriptional regulator